MAVELIWITMNFPCPCCGYLMFSEPPGSHSICKICFWEDDLSQLRFPEMTGANRVSLIEGQKNFIKLGTCEERFVLYVRRPTTGDIRDLQWRPVNVDLDKYEKLKKEIDYGMTYRRDRTEYYYWR